MERPLTLDPVSDGTLLRIPTIFLENNYTLKDLLKVSVELQACVYHRSDFGFFVSGAKV